MPPKKQKRDTKQSIKEDKPKRDVKNEQETEFQKDLKEYIELMWLHRSIKNAQEQVRQRIFLKQLLVEQGQECFQSFQSLIEKQLIKLVVRERPEVAPVDQNEIVAGRAQLNRRISLITRVTEIIQQQFDLIQNHHHMVTLQRLLRMQQIE